MMNTPCLVEGCTRQASRKQLCEAHYHRLRRTGSTGSPPTSDTTAPLRQRGADMP